MMNDPTPKPGTSGGPPSDGPRPKTEGEVRGLRDTSDAEPAKDTQPTQVDPDEAKLSRKEKAEKIPPPGLMGDAAGPSS